MSNDYLIEKVFKKSLRYNTITQLALAIEIMVDGIMIGQFLGDAALAAFGIAHPLFLFYVALGNLFGAGGSVLCGHFTGRNNQKKVNEIFTLIVITIFILSIIITLIFYFYEIPLARLLGSSSDLVEFSASYIRGLSFGALPIMITYMFISFARNDGSPDLSIFSVLIMIITNILFNFLNVQILHLGIFGVAVATDLSFACALINLSRHFGRRGHQLHFTSLSRCRNIPNDLISLIRSGFSSANSSITALFRTYCLNMLLTVLGGYLAIGALSIQGSISSILSFVSLGVGSALLFTSSIFYGEEDWRTLERLIRIGLRTGIVLTCILGLSGLIFLDPLVALFGTSDMVVDTLAKQAVFYLILSLPFYTVNIILMTFYQASRNLHLAALISVCDNLVFVVAFAWLLSNLFGIEGVFLSFLFSRIAVSVLIIIITWVQTKRFPTTIADFMFLPEDYDEKTEKTFNLSVPNDIDTIMSLSHLAFEFFSSSDYDSNKSKKLSLCIEEVMKNIVEYGFEDDRVHFIDLFIKIKYNGRIILRIRDDGIAFNPVVKIEEDKGDTMDQEFGLKIIDGISDDFEYRHSSGINNLLIKF